MIVPVEIVAFPGETAIAARAAAALLTETEAVRFGVTLATVAVMVALWPPALAWTTPPLVTGRLVVSVEDQVATEGDIAPPHWSASVTGIWCGRASLSVIDPWSPDWPVSHVTIAV